MITVNETLFSKLVSGGEPCLLTIDGKYGGYVKAGAAFQDEDGKFKVELVDAERPTLPIHWLEELKAMTVENIDTGFEGLVYAGDPCKKGYYFSKKEHSKEQLQYMQDVLKTFSLDTIVGQNLDRIMFRRGKWISVGEYSIEPTCKITFNDIFVQGN